jgi:hypothetical protein
VTDRETKWLVLVAVIGLIIVFGLLAQASHERSEECKAKGGEIKSYGRTALCVSPDGRILDTKGM